MEADIENQHGPAGDSASSFRFPSIPSTPQPLQPISPERRNQQRLPQSPSVTSNLDGSSSPRKQNQHQHRVSDAADVKARIAYLNSIATTGSPVRSPSPTKGNMSLVNNAAIQRAMLGREEAESTVSTLASQLESAQARERIASERADSLLEQLTEARSRQRHERTVYEREIKLTKKNEYKAGLAVIQLQEDLREARSELESYRARSDHEKAEKEKARQEAFERAYAIASMTEELLSLKQQLESASRDSEELQVVKQKLEIAERDQEELIDIKRKLQAVEQERDVAIAAAAANVQSKEKTSTGDAAISEQDIREKRKQPAIDWDDFYFNNVDPKDPSCPIEIKFAVAQQEAQWLREEVKNAKDTIHFMNMQCQFKACPCRMAERDGVRFVHDYEYDARMRTKNAKRRKMEGLEPELPMAPFYTPVFQHLAKEKGKQVVKPAPVPGIKHRSQNEVQAGQTQPNHDRTVNHDVVLEEPEAPLPPAEVTMVNTESADHHAVLEEAANVPLPSLKPMEIDTSDETPEPTAQLEELTQLIVEPVIEPGTSKKDFVFSTSTNGHRAGLDVAPALGQSLNVRVSDDLFDISPPKKHIPPRPSTAMGVLSVESPIRLVPDSPHVQRSTSEFDLPPAKTTRVALNDTSPVRQARQNRPKSRTTNRDRVRGRSPAPDRTTEHDRSSPAPSTLFPITPTVKHERNIERPVHIRPQTSQGHYANDVHETSTTTVVPLRADIETQESQGADGRAIQVSSTPFSVPGTPNMTREQALAQIRARRDRARSVNMRKTAEDGSKTPGSVARRGINLKDRLDDAKVRDFSQASAPGRI